MGRETQAVARQLRAFEAYYAMYVSLSSERWETIGGVEAGE